jgi:hypothetical protein
MIEMLVFAVVACGVGLTCAKLLDDRFDRAPRVKSRDPRSETPFH